MTRRPAGTLRSIIAAVLVGFLLLLAPACASLPAAPDRSATERTPSASPSPEESETGRASVGGIRRLLLGEDELVISVLGDSTGNDTDEWVAGWAGHLAEKDASVTLHRWDAASHSYTSEPLLYGDGDREITIWNGALPGESAEAALPILQALQPQAPDVVLLNFGHNQGSVAPGLALEQLTATMDTHWGKAVAVAATLQNPALGSQAAISEAGRISVSEWAAQEGIPVIDVYSAFTASPSWETRLMRDDAHPNAEGSRMWADLVAQVLG